MRATRTLVWGSLESAGLVAGIALVMAQLLGGSDAARIGAYSGALVVTFVTVLNVDLYLKAEARGEHYRYVPGTGPAFAELTRAVEQAHDFIWVTRFSRSSIQDQREYFEATDRRIRGVGCARIGSYRRLMNLDSRDKVEYAAQLLSTFYQAKNFYLKGTRATLFYEVILVDHEYAFIAFHYPDHAAAVSSVLRVSDQAVVREWEQVYESLWSNSSTYDLKTKIALTEQERDASLAEVHALRTVA